MDTVMEPMELNRNELKEQIEDAIEEFARGDLNKLELRKFILDLIDTYSNQILDILKGMDESLKRF